MPATLIIEAVDAGNRHLADGIDGSFRIDSRLRLSVTDAGIQYSVEAVAPYTKHYVDAASGPRVADRHIGQSGQAAFLARIGHQPAGLLLLSQDWNGFALIEHIDVDRALRRRGVAVALVAQAETWARSQGLAGLRLETQDTNVAACQLYRRCGFVLGGFDRYLYAAIPAHAAETALFWYRLFAPAV